MRLRAGAKNAKSFCFVPMTNLSVTAGDFWDSGLSDRPGYTQVNDARVNKLSDRTPGNRKGNQPFALILES